MPRVFAYVRVSTGGQTTREPAPRDRRSGSRSRSTACSETVSGSSAFEQRPDFIELMDRLGAR
jgi:DNA invertase Pin-like site-specific DNA recombinase